MGLCRRYFMPREADHRAIAKRSFHIVDRIFPVPLIAERLRLKAQAKQGPPEDFCCFIRARVRVAVSKSAASPCGSVNEPLEIINHKIGRQLPDRKKNAPCRKRVPFHRARRELSPPQVVLCLKRAAFAQPHQAESPYR